MYLIGGGGGGEEVTTINYPNSDDLRVSSCPESSPQYDSTTNMLLLIYGTVKGHYKLTLVSCFLSFPDKLLFRTIIIPSQHCSKITFMQVSVNNISEI